MLGSDLRAGSECVREQPWKTVVQCACVCLAFPSHPPCTRRCVVMVARFVYASNRGLDCLTMFALDGAGLIDGSVPPVYTPTGGKSPRGFNLNAAGDVLVACHQHTSTMTVFDVDAATGALTQWGPPLAIPQAPVCVKFV